MIKKFLKIPYIPYFLLYKIILFNNKKKKEIINTWARSSTIIPLMIGHTINIYNGRKHIPIYISDYLIDYKLGEFAITRLFHTHKKKKN
jgi:small subunit ribosomal protein S19